jgi:hypothetical protein
MDPNQQSRRIRMKKFLNLFFAAVLILVSAESLYAADLKVNGEYRVRAFNFNDTDAFDQATSDGADYIDQRFLLTGTVSQGVTTGIATINLDKGHPWGVQSGSSGYGQDVTSSIHEAYLKVTLPMTNLMAGKRNIKLGHGIILNDTTDNLALSIPLPMVTIDLGYIKLKEVDSLTASGQDMDNNGYLLNVGVNPVENWNFAIFYISDTQKKATADNDATNVFGLTADGQAGPVSVNFEYDGIGGSKNSTQSYKGANVLLNVSGNLSVAKVGLAYLRVTGADANSTDISKNALSGDFVGGNGILLADQRNFGGGINLEKGAADLKDSATCAAGPPAVGCLQALSHNFHALKLYAGTKPMDNLTVVLELFPYVRLVDTAVAGIPDDNIGTEVNLSGAYQIDKNLKFSVLAAMFNAGDVVKDLAPLAGATDGKSVTKLGAELNFTF